MAMLCALYALGELIMFLYLTLFPQYIDITEKEKILLGVKDGEPGFRKSTPSTPQTTPSRAIRFSPTSYNPSTQYSPGSASIRSAFPCELYFN